MFLGLNIYNLLWLLLLVGIFISTLVLMGII